MENNPPLVYPFLFAGYPFFFLAAHNAYQIAFSEILWPLFCFEALILLLYGFLRFWISPRKTALFLSTSLFFFFTYMPLVSFFQQTHLHSLLLPLWILSYLASLVFLKKLPLSPLSLEKGIETRIFTRMALFLLLWSSAEILYATLTLKKFQEKADLTSFASASPLAEKAAKFPDIYYLIFDRYAGFSTLERSYHFNNFSFLKALEKKGFYVASHAQANYLKTAHSLASSLNLEYLDEMKSFEKTSDWRPLYPRLQNHQVGRFLKQKGYRWIHCGSWWNPTRSNPYADLNLNWMSFSELMTLWYQMTLLYPLAQKWKLPFFPDERQEQWHRVQYQFETLKEIACWKGPKFVFMHIISPHVPYVFDQKGRYVSREESLYKSKEENYIEQLLYLNHKILETMDHLQSHSSTPPLVILQADEGPLPQRYEQNEHEFSWKNATLPELQEKFGILNAYTLPLPSMNPSVATQAPYPTISPVNTFRLLFNLQFQENFPLLPDRCIAFEDEKHLYSFFDVTEKIVSKR